MSRTEDLHVVFECQVPGARVFGSEDARFVFTAFP